MILVFGATGNVGSLLVRQLVDAGQAVRAVSRKPDDADLPSEVEVVYGDLERPETIPPILAGVQATFLLNGGYDADALTGLLTTAGVRRVVFQSALATATRPTSIVGGGHLRTEQALQRADLEVTILRPGQFASNTLQWAGMVRAGTVRAPFADVAIPTIDPYDIAAVAALVLTADDEAGHVGAIYPLTGPAISPRQRTAELARVLGRPIGFDPLTVDQAREQLTRNAPPAVVESLLEMLGEPSEEERTELPTVQHLLGRPARDFGTWVEHNRAAFD